MNKIVATAAAVVATSLGAAAFIQHRQRSRQGLLRSVMDAADALEARVRRAREGLHGIPSSGDADHALQEVMRDLLRQRMWLQQNGMNASLGELENVRATLAAASHSLDTRFGR